MATTDRHSFLLWSAGFTQSDTILNDLLLNLEVKLGLAVVSRTTAAQPGSPTVGDCYILPSTPTGAAWGSFAEHNVVIYRDTTWYAFTPISGWPAWVEDDTQGVLFNGTVWVVVSKELPLDKFDATVDPTANEDSGDGYSVGSRWINVTDDKAFICLDATLTAAVWLAVTSPVTTKGDLYTFSTIAARLGVGADGTTLEADSGETTGLKWSGKEQGLNNQTGTTYELVLADAGKLVTCSNAAAIALTIPANASVAFPIGTKIDVLQLGVGQVTVGITTDSLEPSGATKINAQYEVVSLIKITTTSWIIVGGVA